MQGYVTSEPYAVEKVAHFKPGIILLADYGFNTYSTQIENPPRPDRQRSPTWCSASSTPPSSAGTIISMATTRRACADQEAQPGNDRRAARLSIARMKEYGIVDSGDTLRNGIGAMSDERVASFFDKMVRAGVVKPDIDFRKAYTLRFINKGSASTCGRRTRRA